MALNTPKYQTIFCLGRLLNEQKLRSIIKFGCDVSSKRAINYKQADSKSKLRFL